MRLASFSAVALLLLGCGSETSLGGGNAGAGGVASAGGGGSIGGSPGATGGAGGAGGTAASPCEGVPDGVAPAGLQTDFDCKTIYCSSGQPSPTPFLGDVPVDADPNDCSSPICIATGPSVETLAAGSPCSSAGGALCNQAGACVECLAAGDCGESEPICSGGACVECVRQRTARRRLPRVRWSAATPTCAMPTQRHRERPQLIASHTCATGSRRNARAAASTTQIAEPSRAMAGPVKRAALATSSGSIPSPRHAARSGQAAPCTLFTSTAVSA